MSAVLQILTLIGAKHTFKAVMHFKVCALCICNCLLQFSYSTEQAMSMVMDDQSLNVLAADSDSGSV